MRLAKQRINIDNALSWRQGKTFTRTVYALKHTSTLTSGAREIHQYDAKVKINGIELTIHGRLVEGVWSDWFCMGYEWNSREQELQVR